MKYLLHNVVVKFFPFHSPIKFLIFSILRIHDSLETERLKQMTLAIVELAHELDPKKK